MFPVSSDYENELKKPVQRRRISGLINEVLPFSSEDILDGSFSLTNQICGSQDFRYGGVYMAELRMTLTTPKIIDRGGWLKKRIYCESLLYLSDTEEWEYVPLGLFRVAEAIHTASGLEITAYDNMSRFNRKFNVQGVYGTPYELASLACEVCGVSLSMTEEEFSRSVFLPDTVLYLAEDNDIETWRDFLSCLAQAINAFCTIDRAGDLLITKLPSAGDSWPAAEIPPEQRFGDAQFADNVTTFTALKATIHASDGDIVASYGSSAGDTIDIGANPFLQTAGPDADAEAMLEALRSDLARLESVIDEIDDTIEAKQQEIDAETDPARKKKLEKEKADLEKTKDRAEQEKTALETQIATIEQQIESDDISVIQARLKMMAADLAGVQYTPAQVGLLGDPAFELGDVIRFTDGLASENYSDVCVMEFTFKPERYDLVGYGASPETNGARDKSGSGSGSGSGGSGGTKINFITYTNGHIINLEDGAEVEIGRVRFALSKEAEVETWFETKLLTDKEDDDRVHITYLYYLDGDLITDYSPEETWSIGGTHTVNCQYHLPALDTLQEHEWKVSAIVDRGSARVDMTDAHITVWSTGMAGKGGWNGQIIAKDTVPMYPITPLELLGDYEDIPEIITEEDS